MRYVIFIHSALTSCIFFKKNPLKIFSRIFVFVFLLFCFCSSLIQEGKDYLLEVKHLMGSRTPVWATRRYCAMAQATKTEEHWVENRPGPWLRSGATCEEWNWGNRGWGGREPRRRKWWREITMKTELREAPWNVGMGSGEMDIFCWGLHAENLPSLSPKLEYQVG